MAHPMLEMVGPANNNRTEYTIKGKKISVGNQDRQKFEATADQFLRATDKYNHFKAEHSLGTGLIGLFNLALIGGLTYGGVRGANELVKKFKPDMQKALKTTAAILGGMVGFITGGQVCQYTGVPGKKAMKDSLKQMELMDAYFIDK